MKTIKLFAIVLIIPLVLSFAACKPKIDEKKDNDTNSPVEVATEEPLDNKLIGKWDVDLNGIAEMMGEDADVLEAMLSMGIEYSMTMEFKKDGTGVMAMLVSYNGEKTDQNQNYKWTLDGDKLTLKLEGEEYEDVDESTATIKIEGNKMTMTIEEDGETATMVLTRVK